MLKVYVAIALGAAVSFAALSGYDSLPAAQKQDYLWQKIIADTKGDAFMNPLKTIIEVMNPANLWAMTTIHADWRDAGHHKATHGIGAHAKAHFEWKANNYTGMFQQADNCIIRMANAACPGGIAKTAYGPNLAVKCTRDGVESANMQFLWQVDGYAVIPQGLAAKQTCSYFETPLSSHSPLRDDIAMPLRDTFIKAFQKVDPRSMFVGVSQMATETQQGAKGNAPITPQFPFALVLKPAPGLNSVECNFAEPISQLLNLEESRRGLGVPGSTLYEVYAAKDPNPESLEHLGSLVLDSTFTSSTFGDTQLFFRHTFYADEMKAMQTADPNRAKKWAEYVDDESNYKKEGANIYWPLLPVPPPVAPPCHVLVDDASDSACKEDTDADSCAKGGDAEKPGTCTAAGFPVCCCVAWHPPLWYKGGFRCSGQLNDCGMKDSFCVNTVAVAPQMLQTDVTIV